MPAQSGFPDFLAELNHRRADARNAVFLVLGTVHSQDHCWMQPGASGPLKDEAALLEEAWLTGGRMS